MPTFGSAGKQVSLFDSIRGCFLVAAIAASTRNCPLLAWFPGIFSNNQFLAAVFARFSVMEISGLSGQSDNQKNSFSVTSQAEFRDLVVRGRDGDADAIAQLTSKYRNYLLMIANQDLDPAIQAKIGASDVVQQTMIRAQQKFDQFRGTSEKEFLHWLRTSLVNDLKDQRRHYRAHKRNSEAEISQQDRSAVHRAVSDPNLTPGAHAMKQERVSALASELEKLPPDYRTVIELRNFEQLDFAEIGRRMDRSSDAACKLWGRAIEALQSKLEVRSPGLFSGVFELEFPNE